MDPLAYILEDPIRLLTILGGSGGLLYWWDRFRNRPRVRVRIADVGLSNLTLEVENLHDGPNSVGPGIHIEGYDLLGKPRSGALSVSETERPLAPFTPRTIRLAWPRIAYFPETPIALHFATITIPIARGRSVRVRCAKPEKGAKALAIPHTIQAAVFSARRRFQVRKGAKEFYALALQRRNQTEAVPDTDSTLTDIREEG